MDPVPVIALPLVKKALLIAFIVLAGSLQAQNKNPFHGNKDAIEAGRGMFRIYCSPCHGIGAEGGRGPDLTLGDYSVGNGDAAVFQVISGGAKGTEMPGFSERFDSDGVWRIVAYLRSVSGKPAPPLTGNRANGEKLYWGKGSCATCHRIHGRGSRMGPDLTLVGRQRSLAYLRESLVDPDASLTPGYNRVTIVTKAGTRITGVQKGYDAFSAQVMDAQENYHSYFREEVRSMERDFKSMMPAYGKSLTAGELDDLLAYLTSLRGTGENR